MYLAGNLKFLREQIGKTQQELANLFGVEQKTMSSWECGSRTPGIEIIVELARYHGVSLDDLVLRDMKPAMPVYVLNLMYLRKKHGMTQQDMTIKADKIKNKYQTMDPGPFPVSDIEGEGSEFTIKAGLLLESVRRVSYAIPQQGGNATMSTMCLQAKDGQLNFVGLDGHVLAWDKIDYDGEFELLIPKNTIDKLKTLGLTGDIRIRHSNAMAVFATKDFEICTRLVQGEYYKYQNMFKELPLHTVISRKELLDAMVRAKMCTAEKCPVKFELSGSQLNLSIKDQTTDYHEIVDLQEDISEELTIGFDARLVIETLKAFDCDNVGISLQGPKMPMIVEAEDSDFKTIVLPVAIK